MLVLYLPYATVQSSVITKTPAPHVLSDHEQSKDSALSRVFRKQENVYCITQSASARGFAKNNLSWPENVLSYPSVIPKYSS